METQEGCDVPNFPPAKTVVGNPVFNRSTADVNSYPAKMSGIYFSP